MTDQAIKFKQDNPNLKYKDMTLQELQNLPPHNGILNFKISQNSFLILNILNDDSTATKYFWTGSHDLENLDLWYDISKKKGTFIDVGAHTGLYTLTSIKANSENNIICFEPYFMNMSRLITNLRLNGFSTKVTTVLGGVSDFNGTSKFKIKTEKSFLSKGGKIDKALNSGIDVNIFKLDTLYYNKLNQPLIGIKIDTEGEDYNVLVGAKQLIKKHKPKIIIEVRESNKIQIENFLRENNYCFFDVLNLNKKIDLYNYKIDNIANIYATQLSKD